MNFGFVKTFVRRNEEVKTIVFAVVLFLDYCQYDWENHSCDYSSNYTEL